MCVYTCINTQSNHGNVTPHVTQMFDKRNIHVTDITSAYMLKESYPMNWTSLDEDADEIKKRRESRLKYNPVPYLWHGVKMVLVRPLFEYNGWLYGPCTVSRVSIYAMYV